MPDYTPIACSDYDILEVVCTFQYQIELVLDDERVTGAAVTLQTESPGEYLMIRVADETLRKIRIDRIRHLVVLTRPARFKAHAFKAD